PGLAHGLGEGGELGGARLGPRAAAGDDHAEHLEAEPLGEGAEHVVVGDEHPSLGRHRLEQLGHLGDQGVELGQVGVDPLGEGVGVEGRDVGPQLGGQVRHGSGHADRVAEEVGVAVVDVAVPVVVVVAVIAVVVAVVVVVIVVVVRSHPVGGGDHHGAVGLGRLDRVEEALLEAVPVDHDHPRGAHRGHLLGRRGEVVGVGGRRHDDLDGGVVAHDRAHHVAEHVRGHDDVGLGPLVVAAGGARHNERGQPAHPQGPSENGSHNRDGTDSGYHSQISSVTRPRLGAPAAVATDLVLGYGARVVVRAATFEIPAGAVTALIGPNGSGKSTLLHALAGQLEPRAGRLEVAAWERPGGVAYVLQSTKVNDQLPLTVRETVTMGRYALTGPFRRLSAADRAAVDEALE